MSQQYLFNKPQRLVISLAMILITAIGISPNTVLAQGLLCCEDNILSNGDFELGNFSGNGSFSGCPVSGNYVTDWCGAGSPQYGLTQGNDGSPGISMWGIGQNFSSGEGIYQAAAITSGVTYKVRFDGRFSDQVPTGPDSVIVRFQAFTTAPTNTNSPGGVLIGDFVLKNTYWGTFALPSWTAPNGFGYLMVTVKNDVTVNNGAYVSWAKLDNICMQREMVVQSQEPVPHPDVLLYPNPASNNIAVQYPSEWGNANSVQVFDLQARLVDAPLVGFEQGELHLEVENLTSGVYHLKVSFENGPQMVVQKFEKQ